MYSLRPHQHTTLCSTAGRPPPLTAQNNSRQSTQVVTYEDAVLLPSDPLSLWFHFCFPVAAKGQQAKRPPPRPIQHRCALGVAATWSILIRYMFCMFQSAGAKQPTGQPPSVQQLPANTNAWVMRRRIMIIPFEYRSDKTARCSAYLLKKNRVRPASITSPSTDYREHNGTTELTEWHSLKTQKFHGSDTICLVNFGENISKIRHSADNEH